MTNICNIVFFIFIFNIWHSQVAARPRIPSAKSGLSFPVDKQRPDGGLQEKVKLSGHTGQTLYSCEICKKSFSSNGNYKRHMNNHAGVRYKCEYCPKTFTTLSDRKRHISIHTGNYRFSCVVCGKGFNRNYKLNIHYKSHR